VESRYQSKSKRKKITTATDLYVTKAGGHVRAYLLVMFPQYRAPEQGEEYEDVGVARGGAGGEARAK
jgi:hypothetical protein